MLLQIEHLSQNTQYTVLKITKMFQIVFVSRKSQYTNDLLFSYLIVFWIWQFQPYVKNYLGLRKNFYSYFYNNNTHDDEINRELLILLLLICN
jgi:hypothetical protein